MAEPSRALAILNGKLRETYDAGNPFMAQINARAAYNIHILDPLAYERYGVLRNRGPRLVGVYAVEAFIWAEHGDLAVATSVVLPLGNAHFGVRLPRNSGLLNAACQTFGLPFSFERVEQP